MQNNRVWRLFASWIMITALCALVMPLFAQEVTPEADPGLIATESAPEVVTVPVEVFTTTQTANSVISIAAGVVLAILGGGSFALVLSRIDKRTKDEAERLYLALPLEWQSTVFRVLDAAEATLKLAREVTDGKLNTDPPNTP